MNIYVEVENAKYSDFSHKRKKEIIYFKRKKKINKKLKKQFKKEDYNK